MSYSVAFLPWVTKTAKIVKKIFYKLFFKNCVFYIIIENKSYAKIICYTYHHLPIFYAENKIKLFRSFITITADQLSILYFKHPFMVQCI